MRVILEDGSDVIVEPICLTCAHTVGSEFGYCSAFPFGIPEEILYGAFDHNEPWPESAEYPFGDFGLQYKETI